MRIVQQTNERLVLREYPIIFWVNSAILLFLGGLMVMDNGFSTVVVVLLTMAGLLAFVPGITTATFAVGPDSGLFTLRYRRPWGVRKREIPLSHVVGVEVYKPTRRLAFLNLCLADEQRVTLVEGSASKDFAQMAEIMRNYIPKV